MSFSILKKSTRRRVGICASLIVTGVIIFGFLSTYQETKNKAVPKVNLVQTAIYADKSAPAPILYEAIPTEQCIQQLTFETLPASSSSAVAISSEAPSSMAVITSSVASSVSPKKSAKIIPQIPEPPLVNASSPTCLMQTPPPEGYEKLGAEGFVTLALNLADTGRIERGEIEKSSGFTELDAAALKQVTETWQFEACKKADKAVACKQYIRFRWQAK